MARLTASRVAAHQPPRSVARIAPAIFTRLYSASTSLSRSDIESRVLDILKGFDKVDPAKVSLNAHFSNDLGLDSLDTVEVVMAIEEEFSVEIPDKDADEIKSAVQAVEYISKREDAH
ncbi:acyl carrier protein-like protein [Jimgerdemannia flammicorona]|uniref:Acyl carrier protein n=1 Tax=Jimgerdemannia flammicorona TaxID=994334 RepID=A0A433QU55_9FUNG|nr:acyl carrier protein-like protein [Jimgerdemannia flammicorona]